MSPSNPFAAARAFLLDHARPLERAVFFYRYEDGPAADVIDALATFQNEDGGFGHGLEPDSTTPTSGVLCTNLALEYLSGVKAPGHAVKAAIDFLVDTFDPNIDSWRIMPGDTAEYPHAPWWESQDPADRYPINPRFETLSHLLAHRDLAGEFPIDALVSAAIAELPAADEVLGQHDLLCCLRLAESPHLDTAHRKHLMTRLLGWVPRTVETDSSKWADYCLKPLDVVTSAESPFYTGLKSVIPRAIEYELTRQSANGAWEPHWQWYGDRFPEDWATAKVHWSGILTLKSLASLSAFDALTAC